MYLPPSSSSFSVAAPTPVVLKERVDTAHAHAVKCLKNQNNRPFFNTKSSFVRSNSPLSLHLPMETPNESLHLIAIRIPGRDLCWEVLRVC